MCRAIYPHELSDPDFSWLITSFKENNPRYALVEISNLPMVLLKEYDRHALTEVDQKLMLPVVLQDEKASAVAKDE